MPREGLLKTKWKVILPRVARRRMFSKCAHLDSKMKPVFNGVAIIFKPRFQTLPTLQYNIQFMWKTDYTDFVVVLRRPLD